MAVELLNLPTDWIDEEKTYKVCRRDIYIMSQFADWVMREAALSIHRLQPHVPPDFYEQQIRLFNLKVAAKQFRWGSEDVNTAAGSEEGRRQMIWLKIMRGQQNGGAPIQREKIDEIAEDTRKDSNGITRWQALVDILYQQDYPDFFEEVIKPLRLREAEERRQQPQPPSQ